jgi:hypothetical protein
LEEEWTFKLKEVEYPIWLRIQSAFLKCFSVLYIIETIAFYIQYREPRNT